MSVNAPSNPERLRRQSPDSEYPSDDFVMSFRRPRRADSPIRTGTVLKVMFVLAPIFWASYDACSHSKKAESMKSLGAEVAMDE